MHPLDEETINWEAVARQVMLESEDLKHWKHSFDRHRESHWILHIRKPEILLGSLKNLVAYLKTVEPHRLYIYTLIICTIAGTLAEIIALYVKDNQHE